MLLEIIFFIVYTIVVIINALWIIWTFLYWSHEPYYSKNENLIDYVRIVICISASLWAVKVVLRYLSKFYLLV